MGIVGGKASSKGAEGSRRIRSPRWRSRQLMITADGFKFHDVLARLVLTGSPNAWVIEYWYACESPFGCSGRDFVPEALWRRLRAGQTVNVRRANGQAHSGRLDENPQWGSAIVDLAFASVLLLAAGVVSGLAVPHRRGYLVAQAVVTAVEPVTYRDVIRWRIRFAYCDPQGAAQESADEVLTATWKPGDECLAVFRPERPDIATFRSLGAT
jgi:hypothetical protein